MHISETFTVYPVLNLHYTMTDTALSFILKDIDFNGKRNHSTRPLEVQNSHALEINEIYEY